MTNSSLSADTQAMMAFEANKKSAGVAYLLWFFTGGVGGHRFYLGRTGSAVGQLCLCLIGIVTAVAIIGFFLLAALGIWLLIDLFTLGGMVSEQNNKLMQRLSAGAVQRTDPVDELSKYAKLREQGAITDAEFEAHKRRLIGWVIEPQAPAN